jgi:hypothetical protein
MDGHGSSSSSSGGYRLVLELKSLRPFSNFGGLLHSIMPPPLCLKKIGISQKFTPGSSAWGEFHRFH